MINESSLNDLFKSAVKAYPNTTARQHLIHEVESERIIFSPYLGVKTLLVRSTSINEDRQYRTLILFKNVNYNEDGDVVVHEHGNLIYFDKLSLENTNVVLRCSCPDFSFRFNKYNSIDRSLYGSKNKHEETTGTANPMKAPGVCKHLMALMKKLKEEHVIE